MQIDNLISNNDIAVANRWRVCFFSLLVLLTFISVAFVAQYQNSGLQIVTNAHFGRDLVGWKFYKGEADEIVVNGGEVSFYSSDLQTGTAIYQVIANQFVGKRLQLKALVRTEDVVAGKKSWNKARLLLVQYINGKARWSIPHSVIALAGTNEWQKVGEVFRVAPECSEIRVVMQMSRCSGSFFLKDLSLYQVEETSLYRWAKWLMRTAWLCFAVSLVVPYLRRRKFLAQKLPILITVAAILIGTTMPADVKQDITKRISSELETEISEKVSAEVVVTEEKVVLPVWLKSVFAGIEISKVAHFLFFAMLAFALRRTHPTRPVRFLVLDLLMLACATELSQFFIENRSPLAADVLIDMAGGGVGLLFAQVQGLRCWSASSVDPQL